MQDREIRRAGRGRTSRIIFLLVLGLSIAGPWLFAEAPRDFAIEGIAMKAIPAGVFLMGSPEDEPGRGAFEGPRTRVIISQPFWLGRTAVTHGQWKASMGTDLAAQARKAFPNDNGAAGYLANAGDNVAMYFVNWDDAMAFCRKLNERARADGSLPAGYAYTLPTEAQWEYACRAGTTDATYAGPMQILGKNNAPVLDAIAWYGGNSSVGYEGPGLDTSAWPEKAFPGGTAGPRDVALKQPNPWGLCDMLGNVYQWCRDFPADTLSGGTVTDPVGLAHGSDRAVRGGGWHSDAAFCRCAYRARNIGLNRSLFIGFRVALAPR